MSGANSSIGYSRATYLNRVADTYNNAVGTSGRRGDSAQSMLREKLNVNGPLHEIPLSMFELAVDVLCSLALLVEPSFELPLELSWLKIEPMVRRHTKRKSFQSDSTRLLSSVRKRVYKTTAGWHPKLGRLGVGSSKTLRLIGCTSQKLRRHIEMQFLPGMGWHNRTKWHVDHIVPLASALSEEELIQLFHFTNLRPIWGSDNLKKGDQKLFLI